MTSPTIMSGIIQPPTLSAWNPLDIGANMQLSNQNLTATNINAIGNFGLVRAPLPIPLNAFVYWEQIIVSGTTGSNIGLGAARIGVNNTTNFVGGVTSTGGMYSSGILEANGTNLGAYGPGFAAGDVIGIALQNSAGAGSNGMFFRQNGTWLVSSNPVTGVNPAFSGVGGNSDYYPACSCLFLGNSATVRFQNAQFRDAAPSGYVSYARALGLE